MVFRALIFVSMIVLALAGDAVFAAPNKGSTLSQTVEPITCVYTTTATGDTTSSTTDCDSYIAATLDTVEPRAGRPLLGGTVSPTGLTSFRVWVGGVWFTNGASPYLTVTGSEWTLDLAGLGTPLEAGEYTIALEERILTNFLLRSVYENVLDIPVVEITRTDTNDGNRITSSFSSPANPGPIESLFIPDYEQIEQVPSPDAQYLIVPGGPGLITSDSVVEERGIIVRNREAIAAFLVASALLIMLARGRVHRFIYKR